MDFEIRKVRKAQGPVKLRAEREEYFRLVQMGLTNREASRRVGGESARGAGGQSWRNAAEAEQVRETVDELLARLPDHATVGVVTPFRAQKEALACVWADDDRVRVGTVHAFQGGQRDVMVLSPVATGNTPPRTTHWVASQVNLWNVAVTRAKSQLITVGSHAFWQGQAGLPALLAERAAVLRAGSKRNRTRPSGCGRLRDCVKSSGTSSRSTSVSVESPNWSAQRWWAGTAWTCCSRWMVRTRRCSLILGPCTARIRPDICG
ncbi:AAA domain-containing protein [Streptomyces sp. V1I1]|uniref:AAA domain-containing protein n=1 Tax=Streptomyces sp. V1I1 TaxID=3042272 RepID=UPI0027840F91|nr:C-terminal helicase domain-containing protein [Streptomyces sp. V1I1]MDQ0939811.1 hypothetical protein [Streptomyces sp. V1I1]